MSSYLDAIPQAVATIVASVATHLPIHPESDRAGTAKFVVDLTDQVTRTMTKALREAVNAP